MKKIFNILFIFSICLAFNSCLMEDDDIFNDSSANRMNKTISKNLEILQSPENGWVMHYYSDPYRNYGGYSVLVSFDNNDSVKVASEVFKPNESATSMYTIVQSAGPVLTFNTYNRIFHYFSDPNSAVSGIGANGDGMEGDYEFLILEADVNHVLLKGMKSDNKILMTPLPKDMSWETYFAKKADIKKNLSYPKYHLKVNDKQYKSKFRSRDLFFSINPAEADLKTTFTITDKGIRLYEPITVDGVEFQVLNLSDNQQSFVNEDGSVELLKAELTVADLFSTTKDSWAISFDIFTPKFENMSNSFAELLKQTDVAHAKSMPGSRFLQLSIGANPLYPVDDPNIYSINFTTNVGTNIYHGVAGCSMEVVGESEDQLVFKDLTAGFNLRFFPAFASCASIIAEGSPYIVTNDDRDNPTYYKFVSKADPDFWFVAFKN